MLDSRRTPCGRLAGAGPSNAVWAAIPLRWPPEACACDTITPVIKREKRACAECPEQGVSTASAPERIVAKSLLSDQVIIDLVVNKYCESLPLYRQQAVLRRDGGVEIAPAGDERVFLSRTIILEPRSRRETFEVGGVRLQLRH